MKVELSPGSCSGLWDAWRVVWFGIEKRSCRHGVLWSTPSTRMRAFTLSCGRSEGGGREGSRGGVVLSKGHLAPDVSEYAMLQLLEFRNGFCCNENCTTHGRDCRVSDDRPIESTTDLLRDISITCLGAMLERSSHWLFCHSSPLWQCCLLACGTNWLFYSWAVKPSCQLLMSTLVSWNVHRPEFFHHGLACFYVSMSGMRCKIQSRRLAVKLFTRVAVVSINW